MHLNAFFSRASPRLAIPEFLPEFKAVRWEMGINRKESRKEKSREEKRGSKREGK